MVVVRAALTIVGIALVAIAAIMMFNVPVAIHTSDGTIPILNAGNTIDIPIYFPAQGTEDFVFGNDKWTPIGTGTINSNWGTLWHSEKGEWLVITMRGQVIESGSGKLPTIN